MHTHVGCFITIILIPSHSPPVVLKKVQRTIDHRASIILTIEIHLNLVNFLLKLGLRITVDPLKTSDLLRVLDLLDERRRPHAGRPGGRPVVRASIADHPSPGRRGAQEFTLRPKAQAGAFYPCLMRTSSGVTNPSRAGRSSVRWLLRAGAISHQLDGGAVGAAGGRGKAKQQTVQRWRCQQPWVRRFSVKSHATGGERATDQQEAFMALYPQMAQDVIDELEVIGADQRSKDWVARAFRYTILGGKMSRGLMVPQMVNQTVSRDEPNAGNEGVSEAATQMHQARVVGWCLEVLQAAFLVVDDVVDEAQTRRGKPAYHRLPGVGAGRAMTDGLILESLVFRLLRRHLRSHTAYLDLLELFRESIFITECGQLIDLNTPKSVADVETLFTLPQYRKMVNCKTSHYTFYLPLASSLLLTSAATPAALMEARTICDMAGEYFQVQDDYLGCWGDEATAGKGQNDVSERKCTWLAVTALIRCTSPKQRCVCRLYPTINCTTYRHVLNGAND